jgi:hypothetical protein
LGPSREDQEKHLQVLLVQAVHHHQRGQLEEAISLYQQVLQARPAHTRKRCTFWGSADSSRESWRKPLP